MSVELLPQLRPVCRLQQNLQNGVLQRGGAVALEEMECPVRIKRRQI
jgi:hypothetical protein